MNDKHYRIYNCDKGWEIYNPDGIIIALAKSQEIADGICLALDSYANDYKKELNVAAAELGRRGGLKGGRRRAELYDAESRSAMARHAAQKRWERKAVCISKENNPNHLEDFNQLLEASV